MSKEIERLADIQHSIWSHWMKYMFTCGTYDSYGNWLMSKEKVDRWQRQMNTDYEDLTEKEKESDRDQARKTIEKNEEGL